MAVFKSSVILSMLSDKFVVAADIFSGETVYDSIDFKLKNSICY